MQNETQSESYAIFISLKKIQSEWHNCLYDNVLSFLKTPFNDGQLILTSLRLNNLDGECIEIEFLSTGVPISRVLETAQMKFNYDPVEGEYEITYFTCYDKGLSNQSSILVVKEMIANSVLNSLCDDIIDNDGLVTYSLYVLFSCYKMLPEHQRLIIAKDISAYYISETEHHLGKINDHKLHQVKYHVSRDSIKEIYTDVLSSTYDIFKWTKSLKKKLEDTFITGKNKDQLVSLFLEIIQCIKEQLSIDLSSVILINKFIYQTLYNQIIDESANLKSLSRGVTMSVFGQYGSLGYQLFQYSSLIGLAHKYNATLVLPEWRYSSHFPLPFPSGSYEKGVEIAEPSLAYHGDWKSFQSYQHIDVIGYLQSEKYWMHCKEDVFNALALQPEFKKKINEKYGLQKQTLAIHFYTKKNDECPYCLPLPITYYKEALELFNEWHNYQIIILCDDIVNCKTLFDNQKNVFYIKQNNEIEDLCLLMQCNRFVLSNHPLAWWGAYLSQTDGNNIVRPSFKFDLNENSYWPQSWRTLDINN
ncbi:MAG: alpha-1,2-fucosyltransferase [Mucilaginibacter sp.]